ncbi:hypothetical protein G647_06578 [Cladophialophora carrionii CBS 160.54]|uniref:Oxysterol-binding protein n=1 Tax=Cladophialophora carrionii CBS 160.54 TaxID=1279043 RepID=V9D879_9EURO|nr:uncharacterized protein G647_06578 [Cladophialophora carrionii CBS 160.54]ETI22503.1 hypothetical protein G647_06578 [Cladophialophora carrionii CBS 160.54]
MSDSTLADNRSKLKEFIANLAVKTPSVVSHPVQTFSSCPPPTWRYPLMFSQSISTIRGDLSNITAPPFVLDTKSAVELPAFWAERPSVFVAPASTEDPATRALLVLKWFLSSLRSQQYAGRSEAQGIKKPINAFLGEVFLASWEDDAGLTRLVSEQVSHHPPVTACRVWNEEHGVAAEGYTRQEITFSGSINIQQIGHATLYLARHDETYLIPLPNIKIKGVLTGSPYPELQGTHYIPSTNGYTSVVDFSGKGLFSSSDKKHSFEAKVYRDGEENTPLYTVSGHWDGEFIIHDCQNDVDMETFNVMTAKTTPLQTEPLAVQDPWESRRAWQSVREALERGDMQDAADAKAKVEDGQREMRKTDADGKQWKRRFYESESKPDEVAAMLATKVGLTFNPQDTVGAWRFRRREWDEGLFKKPYHGDLLPEDSHTDSITRNGPNRDAIVNGTARTGRTGDAVVNGVTPAVSSGAAQYEEQPQPQPQHDLSQTYSFHRQSTIVGPEEGQQPAKSPHVTSSEQHQVQVQVDREADSPRGKTEATSLVADRTRHESPVVLAQPDRKASANMNTSDEQNGDVRQVSGGGGGESIPRDMSPKEKAQVEDFLRDQYSSRGSK